MARASLIIFRFKTNVSLKLLPEWMLSVRPNPVWVKQPFLFWQHCNNWIKKRQTTQVALKCLSCATLVNLLFKSQKNIKDFQNTWKISRYVLGSYTPLGNTAPRYPWDRWHWGAMSNYETCKIVKISPSFALGTLRHWVHQWNMWDWDSQRVCVEGVRCLSVTSEPDGKYLSATDLDGVLGVSLLLFSPSSPWCSITRNHIYQPL